MESKKIKIYRWFYFLITLLISFYIQLKATTLLYFVIGSIVTFAFFVGLYFCVKNIQKGTPAVKVGKVVGAIVFLGLIYGAWGITPFYGFHSSYCYNLVGKNILTKTTKVYCNLPPWYTTTVGGEEARLILLNDCTSRKSEFYDKNPNYCDVYKNPQPNKDWTQGPNP